jgi:DNA-binding transcriptional MocR family regulator
VYACLASYADWDTGMCWPSRNTLAEACGVSLATVKRALAGLEAAGVISVERRTRLAGKNDTNLYRLPFAINRPVDNQQRDGVKSAPLWGHKRTQDGVTDDPQTRLIERQGMTTSKTSPESCGHLPVDDTGYCTACGTEVA